MEVGKPSFLPESSCLCCGRKTNMASSVGCDSKPSPGDVTVCIACGHLMAFADDLSLRDLTKDELLEMAGDERIVAINNLRGSHA